jgi:hypothetical protein
VGVYITLLASVADAGVAQAKAATPVKEAERNPLSPDVRAALAQYQAKTNVDTYAHTSRTTLAR